MNIFDLVFLFSVLLIILGLIGFLAALLTRRGRLARRLGTGLVGYVLLYALALVTVSLSSPQHVLAMGEVRCFDEWCAAVQQVRQAPSIGNVKPQQASFTLVTLQVSSQAKRISQRALDAGVYLLDSSGAHYDISPNAQRALEAAGQAGQPLNSLIDPGGSFSYTAAFDLPAGAKELGLVMAHGAFPGIIVIGDEQSFLHKPTVVKLSY
jgi:hypothetical protein